MAKHTWSRHELFKYYVYIANKNYYKWSHYKNYKCAAVKNAKKLCKTDLKQYWASPPLSHMTQNLY